MDIPDINAFDIYHAGISGGKDSTDLLLWLRFESGLPLDKIDAVFCDTGNEDALTYAFIDVLRDVVAPVQIRVVQPERDFWELAQHKGRFPAGKARFCTQDLKIIPSREDVKRLMQEGKDVLVMNGVRRAEGRANNTRADAAEWEFDIEGWAAWIHRPILHHTIDDVWAMHRRYIPMAMVEAIIEQDTELSYEHKALLIQKMRDRDIPCNPLYPMGAARVGCFPCFNSAKREVRAMAKYRPQRIDFIAEQEVLVGAKNYGVATFFRRTTVPKTFRRMLVTTKTGTYDVATIRDVVDWAQTARGGKQYDMDFDLPPASACDIGGMCE